MIIIYKDQKGNACVLYPVSSPELSIEDIALRDVPEGTDYKIIESESLPEDKTFRNAWDIQDWSIVIKMDAAREIWKDKWRKARKPKLEALDIEFMRAIESGDVTKQEDIKAKKQTLRDVTSINLDSASSTEELKAVWPDCLK